MDKNFPDDPLGFCEISLLDLAHQEAVIGDFKLEMFKRSQAAGAVKKGKVKKVRKTDMFAEDDEDEEEVDTPRSPARKSKPTGEVSCCFAPDVDII
jgi:hypothetical protein